MTFKQKFKRILTTEARKGNADKLKDFDFNAEAKLIYDRFITANKLEDDIINLTVKYINEGVNMSREVQRKVSKDLNKDLFIIREVHSRYKNQKWKFVQVSKMVFKLELLWIYKI